MTTIKFKNGGVCQRLQTYYTRHLHIRIQSHTRLKKVKKKLTFNVVCSVTLKWMILQLVVI